jgi:hypothetical protein
MARARRPREARRRTLKSRRSAKLTTLVMYAPCAALIKSTYERTLPLRAVRHVH